MYQRRIKQWNDAYREAQHGYVSGAFDRFEAEEKLRELGFRSDAVRIELIEWRKLRDDYEKRHR
jgi:hypothetical protein